MNKYNDIIDVDAIVKELEQEEKDAEATGVYVQLQQQKIPLRVQDMTLWNWTKIFMMYISPLKDSLKKKQPKNPND